MTMVKRRLLLPGALSALMISGCAHQPPLSLQYMDPVDKTASDGVTDRVVEESAKLFETVDKLNQSLSRRAEPRPLEAIAPDFDPLEAESISLTLSDARISDALRALAAESSLNLIIEPQVVALEHRATLTLRDISVREAIRSILDIYDVHGERTGKTLRVSLMEEKSYVLDFLNSGIQLNSTSGGNVFGAGGSLTDEGGTNALTGNLSLSAQAGSSETPYQMVEKQVLSIVGNSTDNRDSGSNKETTRLEGERNAIVAVDPVSSSLYVKARPGVIRAVDEYISHLKKTVGRQVYIEAQLIDVRLSDGYQFGVDWTLLRSHLGAVLSGSAASVSGAQMILPNADLSLGDSTISLDSISLTPGDGSKGLGMVYRNQTFGAVIQALDAFGNVTVLSNPQIMVRNGTPALLSVGTTSRFVSSSSTTQTTGSATTTTSDVETDSVFSGIMVGVLPYVHEDGQIELLVRPMQTEVSEASLQLVEVGGDTQVSLPEVNLKGLTTTLRLNDGDIALIGGLIDQASSKEDQGVPGLSALPVIGRLFGTRESLTETRELVIVLRTRVL